MNSERTWVDNTSFIKIDCPSIEKQVNVDGFEVKYRINILDKNSTILMVNIPGIGEDGSKELGRCVKSFNLNKKEPFFNVITFLNPKPYSPETVSKAVCKMLDIVGDEIPKPKSIILNARSQGGVAACRLLNDGILKKFPVKGIIFQAPVINQENMSNLLKIGCTRFRGLVKSAVSDPEKWNQEIDGMVKSNIKIDPNIEPTTPVLLTIFDKDRLIDNSATEKILRKSFPNLQIAEFESSKTPDRHNTDSWMSMIGRENNFISDCSLQK